MILADCPELRSIPWRCVVIDEAHRLKNRNCKLLEGLKMMDMVSNSSTQGFTSKGFRNVSILSYMFFYPAGAQSPVDRDSSPEHRGGALQLTQLPGAGEVPV